MVEKIYVPQRIFSELNETISNSTIPNFNNSIDNDIFVSVIYCAFGVLSITSNITVNVAMYKAHLLKIGGYLIVFHYSMTDIIVGSLVSFYMPLAICLQKTLGPSYVYGFLMTFGETACKLFILLMAFTRFYSVMWPFKARGMMSLTWYHRATLVTWLASIVACIPLWAGRSYIFDTQTYHWYFNPISFPWVTIYGATINIGVTLAILTVYPICCFKVLKQRSEWNNHKSTTGRRQSGSLTLAQKEGKILLLFFLNGIIFILYWLPRYLVTLWDVTIPDVGFFEEFMRCIQISYNPFVYICINSNIRDAVLTLLRHRKVQPKLITNCRQRQTSSETSYDVAKY